MTANKVHNHELLATSVRERRLELGLGIAAAAARAGMSKDTWRRIEEGAQVRETSYAKIDPALGWASGSCRGVLEGAGDPIEVNSISANGGVIVRIPDAELGKAITGAMVAVADTMTAAEIREVSRKVVDELKQRGIM